MYGSEPNPIDTNGKMSSSVFCYLKTTLIMNIVFLRALAKPGSLIRRILSNYKDYTHLDNCPAEGILLLL